MTQQPVQIAILDADLQAFFKANPAATQAVQNIALQRMLRERDAEIARLKDGKQAMAQVTPMPEAKEG